MRRIAIFVSLILVLILVHPGRAHAYLDPGTGSIMLQALIGVVGGALVAGRLYWSKIKSVYWRLRNRTAADDPGKDSGR